MEWLLVVLVVGAGGVAAARWRRRREVRGEEREELEGVRRLADEDVTVFGEQLRRLDTEVAGRELSEAARVDYQSALDAYESAQRAVPRMRAADDISKVTDTLAAGRYALACVQARAADRPVPEIRVPCFFNPQHGPADTHVVWTHPGRGTRRVPACAQDAARVAAHEAPETRKVKVGSRLVPYWEAGSAFAPYTEGYFASAVALGWAWTVIDPVGGAGGHGGYGDHGGYGGADGGGGFDGGGFDGGGGGGDG